MYQTLCDSITYYSLIRNEHQYTVSRDQIKKSIIFIFNAIFNR